MAQQPPTQSESHVPASIHAVLSASLTERDMDRWVAEYSKGLEDGVKDTLTYLERALDDGLDVRQWIADVRTNLETP